MSPLHTASLVERSLHSKAMLELLELEIDRNLIGELPFTLLGETVFLFSFLEHLVQVTIDTVAYAYGSASSSTRGRTQLRSTRHLAFSEFVLNVVSRSEVDIAVLLVALVYINRSRAQLSIQTEEWACERVFLGAIILAAKVCLSISQLHATALLTYSFQYTNDSTLKNIHWALVTGVFGKRDVGRIEREFLDVLGWNLAISEADIIGHHKSLMALSPRARHHYLPSSSPIKINRPAILSTHSEEHVSWSDSDSDVSSSPSPLTPPTPSHLPSFMKSPTLHDEHSSQSVHVHHLFSGPWSTGRNASQIPTALPRIRIAA